MEFGRLLFYFGIVLVIFGSILVRFPDMLNWFGKLPGDMKFQGEKFSVYFPLTSLVLVSVVLSVGMMLMGKIFPK